MYYILILLCMVIIFYLINKNTSCTSQGVAQAQFISYCTYLVLGSNLCLNLAPESTAASLLMESQVSHLLADILQCKLFL